MDIRDQGGAPLGARPLMLVDVLHALQTALGCERVDKIALWSE
jgi:hypothetical protein